jgi:hypothetical protein
MVAVDGDGVATFTTDAFNVGSYTITASYAGDTNFIGSTSSALTQVVNQAATTTSLTSSPNPSLVGESVTFTATVAPEFAAPTPPTGNVTFLDGATPLGTVAIDVDGVATFTTSTLGAGSYTLRATYAGDTNFGGSDSNELSQIVGQVATTTSLTSNPNPSTYGESVTFTATVAPEFAAPTPPTGNVTFLDGATPLGTVAIDAAGVATFTTDLLDVGSYTITASYAGDTSYVSSASDALTQVVNRAATTTNLVSGPNPSTFGESVTFTATVAADSLHSPTGNVTFLDGATPLGMVAVDGDGVATFTTSTLGAGSYTLRATYAGDTNFGGSDSNELSQIVGQVATTTSLVSSKNSTTLGESVTFTASVSSNPSSGNVTFKDGSTPLGSVAVDGEGVATFTTSALGVGSHTITAEYGGNSNYAGSVSNGVIVVVSDLVVEAEPPLAVNDAAGTLAGQAVSIAVVENDVAGSNNTLSVQSVGQPGNGSVVINGNAVVYTPAAGFSGLDSFTYTLVDGNNLTDSATVSVIVAPQLTSGQAAQVAVIDNQVGGSKQFTSADATITIDLPSEVYSGTLGEEDIFYFAVTWLITPTTGNSGNLQLANLAFDLSAYVNDNKLEDFVFSEPVTVTINYSEQVLGDFAPATLQLLFLEGDSWSDEGIELVSHDTENRRFVVRLSHLTEFAFFAASPTNEEVVEQPSEQLLFMPKLGR